MTPARETLAWQIHQRWCPVPGCTDRDVDDYREADAILAARRREVRT